MRRQGTPTWRNGRSDAYRVYLHRLTAASLRMCGRVLLLLMFSKRSAWELNPNRFTEVHRQLQATGVRLFDLTVSNPTRVGLRFETGSILNALSNPGVWDYDPQPKGLAVARQAVTRYYKEQYEENSIDPDALVLTTSTSEGYSYVFRLLCDPDDEVLVPKPSYPLFEFLADIQDVKLRPYPLLYDHGWQIDFPSLENALSPRSRAVVLVHPNNPTGSFVSAQERVFLNSFCRKHGLALIVDEVFLDYALDGMQRPSFVTNSEVLTFTLSGVSKISGLPQMKLAWVAVSGPPTDAKAALDRLEIIADTYLSMSAPIQLAAATLLEQRKQLQPLLIERVRSNLEELDRQLGKQKLFQRLRLEGGWYAVVRVLATQPDEELAIDLLRRGSVLVHPGHFYDFPNEGYLVISLLPPPEEFRQGVKGMIAVLENDKPSQRN